jgi:hypothetical protein
MLFRARRLTELVERGHGLDDEPPTAFRALLGEYADLAEATAASVQGEGAFHASRRARAREAVAVAREWVAAQRA